MRGTQSFARTRTMIAHQASIAPSSSMALALQSSARESSIKPFKNRNHDATTDRFKSSTFFCATGLTDGRHSRANGRKSSVGESGNQMAYAHSHSSRSLFLARFASLTNDPARSSCFATDHRAPDDDNNDRRDTPYRLAHQAHTQRTYTSDFSRAQLEMDRRDIALGHRGWTQRGKRRPVPLSARALPLQNIALPFFVSPPLSSPCAFHLILLCT